MTKEQYNKLTKYESMFHSAVEAKYIRAIPRELAADFISVCHELCIHINPSCPACVLKAALTLGKLYFDYKEQNPDKPADADPSDKADSLTNQNESDSIDLFEELPKPVKTAKPSKTTATKKKASQNANKQALKKKSK